MLQQPQQQQQPGSSSTTTGTTTTVSGSSRGSSNGSSTTSGRAVAVLYCNRAAALLAVGQYADALADCCAAAAHDGAYARPWKVRDRASEEAECVVSILELATDCLAGLTLTSNCVWCERFGMLLVLCTYARANVVLHSSPCAPKHTCAHTCAL